MDRRGNGRGQRVRYRVVTAVCAALLAVGVAQAGVSTTGSTTADPPDCAFWCCWTQACTPPDH